MNKLFQQRKEAAFSTYDPDAYDPSIMKKYNGADGSGTGVEYAAPGNKMQVNLTLSNPAAVNLTFEMWSWLNSQFRVKKADYANGVYTYIPMLSFEGLVATAAGDGGTVGFLQNGDMVIRGDDAVPSPVATMTCKEIGYASFFEASGITPFTVAYFRITCSNSDQIDEQYTIFRKTFSGGISENKVSPRSYFEPTQFQNYIIDIPVSFDIKNDIGLKTVILAGQSVKMNLFIKAWTEQSLQ